MRWIAENAGTVLIILALLILVARIVTVLRRDKKAGKSSCGCQCGSCPMAGACHKNAQAS